MFTFRAEFLTSSEVRSAGASGRASGVPLAAVVHFGCRGFIRPSDGVLEASYARGGRDEILRSKRK